MRTVRLSRASVTGAVAEYWKSGEFPESIYVALETSVGFGEGCGGVGCGSVVNALYDFENGHFFDMARIDELVLNLPDRGSVRDALEAGGERAEREYWSRYPWELASGVNGTRIEWE